MQDQFVQWPVPKKDYFRLGQFSMSWLAEEPFFSQVEWEETHRMKVEVLSFVLVLLL